MRLRLVAVGRLKAGPERELAEHYRLRAQDLGRGLGCSGPTVVEFAESRARSASERAAEEAARMLRECAGAEVIALDERGASPTSAAFADALRRSRDGGRKDVVLAVGGPDGLGAALREAAASTISFGAMTMPHGLVRVLALEQLYRAFTILSGHPYHREGPP